MNFNIKEHFKFVRMPFSQNIPVEFLYQNDRTREILSKMSFAAADNRFLVLSGPVGTGKSTILRCFTGGLNKDEYQVFYISCSAMTPRFFYLAPLIQMGIKPKFYMFNLKEQFNKEVIRLTRTQGRKVVYIIDEAHRLEQTSRYSNECFEEIRFFLNIEYDSGNPLSLILCGQEEIWEQSCLGNAKCKAIVQRIDLTCKTEALTVSEVGAYIAAHLKSAGGAADLFEKDAIKLIANCSGGIPRVINKICTQGLLYAMSQSANVVTGEMISSVFANEELPNIVLSK